LVLLGSVCLYVSIFTWTLYNNDDSCRAIPWLLGVGFVLMFGSLFAKTWRIERIFCTKFKEQVKLVNQRISAVSLLIIIGIACGIEITILIIWMSVHSPSSLVLTPDIYRPSKNYTICSTDDTSWIFIGLLLGYHSILLGWGVYLAYRIRNVTRVLFNESKLIGFAIYNGAVFAVVVSVVQAVQAADREALFVVRSMGILIGTGLSVAVLFIPKLHYIRKGYNMNTGAPRLSFFISNKAQHRLMNRIKELEQLLKANNIPLPVQALEDESNATSPSSSKELESKRQGSIDFS